MGDALQVAVIGAGQIAQRGHLPGFLQAGAEITAICDNGHSDLEEIAARFNVRRCYSDWQEMLAEGGFDAVSICTPPYLHCDMALAAARRGHHVLVEKPMAMTLEECDRMSAAAEQAGVLLMVSLNQRFMAAHQAAKEILDSAALGRPYLVHGVFGHSGPEVWSPAQQWYFRPEQAGKGVVSDLGYHKIDLVRWLTGQDLTQVSAVTNTFEKQTALEDTAAILFQLSGGTLGTLHVSWVFHPDWDNSLVIRCERGVLTIPTEAADPVRVLRVDDEGRQVEQSYHTATEDISGWFGAVGAFVRAVEKGEPSPVPASAGRAALAAVLGAAEAAAQKRVVSLV